MANEEPEGILQGGVRKTSVSTIKTIDLLCEGPISGLVTEDYVFNGTAGKTGWDSATVGNQYNKLRSLYFNETPVMNINNLFNFQQVDIDFSRGEPNGETISDGVEQSVSKTRNVSERLRGPTFNNNGILVGDVDAFAKYYRILKTRWNKIVVNLKLSAFSKTPQEPGTVGDVVDTSVSVTIQTRALFTDTQGNIKSNAPFQNAAGGDIVGKITSTYIQTYPINLTVPDDQNFVGWEVKVYRSTAESTSIYLKNQTFVDSITEHYADTFCYPNAAMVSSQFKAEYFSEIPKRAFDCRLKKIRIPSNYNPVTRTYTGAWDGRFSDETSGPYGDAGLYWSDNPAWCFYDLLTSKRYGLGKYIDENLIDKWSLYDISRYCDVLVDDGFGALEPRFTCNLLISSREEAFKVINDMASIFRAIAFYSAGGIHTIQDSEKNPVYSFTNANVKDGDFTYSNSAKKVRHTVAMVRYNDKRNFYKPAVEYIEEVDGIRRYGIREKEVTAFGCSSRGQALRFGRWILYTENLETETISFTAGTEAAYLRPGDVVKVYDTNIRTERRGGRIESVSYDTTAETTTVVLDSKLNNIINTVSPKQHYHFDLLTPTYTYYASLVEGLNSEDADNIRRAQVQKFSFNFDDISVVNNSLGEERTQITFQQLIDYTGYMVTGGQVWTSYPSGENLVSSNLDEAANVAETFRVVNIQESETNEYSVQAVEYNPLKYAAIESGLSFDNTTFTVTPHPPKSVQTEIVTPAGTSHTKYLKYTISQADTTSCSCTNPLQGLYNYYVYVKKGTTWVKSDFNQNYSEYAGIVAGSAEDTEVTDASKIPNASYRIGVLDRDTLEGQYVPFEGGRYSFKVFAANAEGGTSSSVSTTSNEIPAINPVLDTTLTNLRLSNDTDTSNSAGANDASLKSFKGTTSPEFRWTFSLVGQTLTNLSANYFYRFTVRKHNDNSNTPKVGDSNILYEKANITSTDAGSQLDLSQAFSFTDNLASVGGPYRKFDVVVEAHTASYSSSANNDAAAFSSSTDSSYNHSQGYDIITVENKQISREDLNLNSSTHGSMNAEVFFQIAEPRGQVKIVFTKCTVSDVQGGFIFLSTSDFNLNDVEGKSLANTDIQAIRFNSAISTGSILEVLPNNTIRDADKVYIAIGLFDTFDKQRESDDSSFGDSDLRKSIKINGVGGSALEVFKSASVSESVGQGFKHWIRINLNGSWYGQGIKRVVELDPSDTDSNSDVTTHDRYQPWHYKNFIGYRGYACSFTQTYVQLQNAGNNASIEFYDHKKNDGTFISYLQNWFCGVTYTEWDEQLQTYIEELRNTHGYDSSTTDHDIIKIHGYPTNHRMKGGSRSNVKVGFKRYRVFFDAENKPVDDKYAIMGVSTDNEPYIPYLAAQNIGTGPEGNMPVHQSDWDRDTYADWNGIIEAEFGYTLANTPYMGDIPGQIKHHAAGFGQGWGGLLKNERYFDVHMGTLIDSSYLTDAFFAVVETATDSNDFTTKENW